MMTKRFLLINRVLYAALTLAVGTAAAVPWFVDTLPQVRMRPVAVPVVTTAVPVHDDVSLPIRNPFDVGGEEWVPKEAPPSAPVVAAGKAVRGIIRIGEVTGALTEKGFVPVGEMLNEGRLEDVRGGEVVVSTPQGEQSLPVENGLRQRLESLRPGG